MLVKIDKQDNPFMSGSLQPGDIFDYYGIYYMVLDCSLCKDLAESLMYVMCLKTKKIMTHDKDTRVKFVNHLDFQVN